MARRVTRSVAGEMDPFVLIWNDPATQSGDQAVHCDVAENQARGWRVEP